MRLMSGVAERILCVEDDLQVRRLITRLVRAAGYDCAGVGDAHEARDLLGREPFSVVLCDIGLPGESGLDLLREVSGRSPEVAMLMVTGQDEPEIANVALELGAYGYVTKPFARERAADQPLERPPPAAARAGAAHLRGDARGDRRPADGRAARSRCRGSPPPRPICGSAYRETVDRLGRAIEYHDGMTGAHVERVA